MIKSSVNLIKKPLTNIFNHEVIDCCNFPKKLKSAEVVPVFKKDLKTDKKNYRPISLLPVLSKVFERLICQQLDAFMSSHLSPFLCGFRKGFNTQHALLKLVESWKVGLDKGKVVGSFFMDLSKAFDSINHDLLIAKLEAYGLSRPALKLILSILRDRKQRTKINSTFSSWIDIIAGVPQGSIVGPHFFNISLNDIFLFLSFCLMCNFADDNGLYAIENNLETVKSSLITDAMTLKSWFFQNYLELNLSKCKFMCLGTSLTTTFDIEDIHLECIRSVKLLGVTLDNEMNFDQHIKNAC